VASTTEKLITFAKFEKLPDQEIRQELRHGEVVNVAPPKHGHYLILRRLRRLFEALAAGAGEVDTEFGFQVGVHEYRIADVAFLSKARWDRIPVQGYLQGAPELVIEVLSPSNTAAEIQDKKEICLENGTVEFWVVDAKRHHVKVTTREGRTAIYKAGQQIPLFFGGSIAVDAIFG
jgi:Uma2 family endonuclease